MPWGRGGGRLAVSVPHAAIVPEAAAHQPPPSCAPRASASQVTAPLKRQRRGSSAFPPSLRFLGASHGEAPLVLLGATRPNRAAARGPGHFSAGKGPRAPSGSPRLARDFPQDGENPPFSSGRLSAGGRATAVARSLATSLRAG